VWIAINEKNASKMVVDVKEFGFDLSEINKEIF
jgi:hypothetical protein